jgi:molybdate transport system ATP-binding protein
MKRKMIHLSSGENRKVLIARALMQAPELLILEDPCGGLDKHSREKLLRHLDNLIDDESGPTIIIVAPRLEEIPTGIKHFAIVNKHTLVNKVSKEQYETLTTDNKTNRTVNQKKIISKFPEPIQKDWGKSIKPDIPLISINNTTVKYGTKTILDNINWTVNPKENWAIIGSNGAGKSTLISLIRRDCPQCYSNNIRVFGQKHGIGNSIWDLRKKIGFVCAESHTFQPPDLDCLSIVLSGLHGSIGLYNPTSKEDKQQAYSWMKCLHVDKLADTQFGELSLMEKRLVLLARALVRDPLLLILDEVCQSLPADARTIVLSTLDNLCHHKSPLSMICVSHHRDELPKSVNHTLYLNNGKVEDLKQFIPMNINSKT